MIYLIYDLCIDDDDRERTDDHCADYVDSLFSTKIHPHFFHNYAFQVQKQLHYNQVVKVNHRNILAVVAAEVTCRRDEVQHKAARVAIDVA